jgi:hypothetical protein
MDTETAGDDGSGPLGDVPPGDMVDVFDPDGLGAAWGEGVPGRSDVDEQPATSTRAATTSAFTARP